jgi:hypothetical protein
LRTKTFRRQIVERIDDPDFHRRKKTALTWKCRRPATCRALRDPAKSCRGKS